MNQPTIKTAFKLIVAIIITFGLSLALQSILADVNWQNPTCTPPLCNVPAPINVGSSTMPVGQTKHDGLSIYDDRIIATSSGLAVAGILTVNSAWEAFFVGNNAPYNNVGIGAVTSLPAKLTIEMGAAGMVEGLHIRRKNNIGQWSYLNIENENGVAGPIFKVNQSGNVGIGTANPGYKLDVQGSLSANTIRLKTNASQGRVLMSDNLGNASWVATSSLGLGGGGGAVAMASGEINDGQQIPLPAGVTDQNNCKWTVSFGQNLTSLFSAYPTFYNTDVGADRIVHAIVSVPGYPSQPGTANYLIVCNTSGGGGGGGGSGAPDYDSGWLPVGSLSGTACFPQKNLTHNLNTRDFANIMVENRRADGVINPNMFWYNDGWSGLYNPWGVLFRITDANTFTAQPCDASNELGWNEIRVKAWKVGGGGGGGGPDFETIRPISAGGNYSFPHGLGVVPKYFEAYYCRTADPTCAGLNFRVDTAVWPGTGYGTNIGVNNTNFIVNIEGNGPYLRDIDGLPRESGGYLRLVAWKTGGGGGGGGNFGGSYEYYCAGATNCGCASAGTRVNNPLTGGQSCPSGFTAYCAYSSYDTNVTNILMMCYR